MIVNAGYRGKVGAAVPKFTYTGQYNVRKDGVVELLTSGTIVFLDTKVIDVFMVGGGGAGGYQTGSGSRGSGGGGGGYTRTVRRKNVIANQSYNVTVGAGGRTKFNGEGLSGTASGFGDFTVSGGNNGPNNSTFMGGNGGSGGGGGVHSNSNYGVGGSDGNDGETGYPTSQAGGKGQGSTTCEFGEATGKLYAGGGGGGRYMVASSPVISMGGSGGGGAGGWCSDTGKDYQPAAAGVANTGGGGGGGVRVTASNYTNAASGGSGIVCFRDAQELPELAGTWVLNERMYAPESDVYFTNQDFTIGDASNPNKTTVRNLICTTAKIEYTTTIGYAYTLYTFSNNTWGTNKYTYLTFPAGATASDEFRAWLASNATKQ